MRAAIALLFLAPAAYACDWQVTRTVDSMTDTPTCTVRSDAAKVSFYIRGKDRPNVSVSSPYRATGLTIRIDDNPAVRMGDNAYSRQKALDALLPQLQAGKRIRTSFRDYPNHQEGDAPVCNLPQLLAECRGK